ncbi:hypothetical protein BGZ63DRAFT_407511 [Mariannaea sp. PMI_226]|nr:hypothetical protein BGZ63DRAFT_407511 [Mariannaea sp. PMI_226]
MCHQPQVLFKCGCIHPRPLGDIPSEEYHDLVQTEDGLVYKLCGTAEHIGAPCDPQFIETDPLTSIQVRTMCVDCLAKAYDQPLPVVKPSKPAVWAKKMKMKKAHTWAAGSGERKIQPDLAAFEEDGEKNDRQAKLQHRTSTALSITGSVRSFWMFGKKPKYEKIEGTIHC